MSQQHHATVDRQQGSPSLGLDGSTLRIIKVDATGQVYIANAGSLTVDQATAANLNAQVFGGAAQNAAPSGNPVLVGEEGRDTLGTVVTNGNVVRAVADRYGRRRVVGPPVTLASSDATPVTTATDTTIIAAPSAGNHLVIYYIHASNGGATATDVMWRDGAAGTRRYRTTMPQYGVFAHNLKPGSWSLTTATALVLTTSAAGSVHWTVEYEIHAD